MDWTLLKTLASRWRRRGDFVRRTRYELTLTNLATQRRIGTLRMRRWGFILMGVLTFVAIGVVGVLLVVSTPLRNSLPTRLQSDLRDDYVNMSVRLDSALAHAAITEAYLQNINAILIDSVGQEAVIEETQLLELPLDSLLESTESERAFVNRFEASERYNLSVLSPIAAEGMTFVSPSPGAQYDVRVSEGGMPSLIISGAATLPVSAVYRGTVISTYYTTANGITVAIQHPNDFITVYSGLNELFVAKGDKVKAGTRIGLSTESRPVTFELWHNGTPLSPEGYISL